MFWWLVILGVVALTCYLSLRQEKDDSGGDFNAFVKKADPSKPKVKKASESFDEVYSTPGRQVLILYATAYGFAEVLGKKLYTRVRKESEQSLNLQPRLVNMKSFEGFVDLAQETTVYVIASTAGDGQRKEGDNADGWTTMRAGQLRALRALRTWTARFCLLLTVSPFRFPLCFATTHLTHAGVPPSDSRDFFDYLSSNKLDLSHLHFAVLALGDTAYPHFCRAGKTLDARFLELGAQPIAPRVDVDREDWGLIDSWMDTLMRSLESYHLRPEQLDYLSSRSPSASGSLYSRTNPFMAEVTVKYCLTQLGQAEDKEIIHVELDLADSGLEYTAGDAVGIVPTNNPSEVDTLLKAWGRTGKERIFSPVECSLRETLLESFDLKAVKTSLLDCLLKSCSPSPIEAGKLQTILSAGDSKQNAPLQEYLHHREILDVLVDFPKAARNLTVRNMLAHLRPLAPRYYSISSTPVLQPSTVSVTAAVVRYSLRDKPRTGVCTTFLSDRTEVKQVVPVFISSNPDFRLPPSGETPIIMVGPGTGLAPFRAFVQERVARGASGKNTLYYGCRRAARDFTYKDELESLAAQGKLNLRCAFSRDQKEKVYVQHLVEQDGAAIAADLQAGGHFYICGDGSQMAVDVTRALEALLQKHVPGVSSLADAQEYIAKMEKEGRFEKDVWIT